MTDLPPSVDQIARRRHADALAHLSPGVRMRLRPRAHRVTHRRPWSLPFAGALAALFALAIGLQWRAMPPTTSTPAATPAAAMTTAPIAATAAPASGTTTHDARSTSPTARGGDITEQGAVPAALASVEEDPEFYRWLGDGEGASLTPL